MIEGYAQKMEGNKVWKQKQRPKANQKPKEQLSLFNSVSI